MDKLNDKELAKIGGGQLIPTLLSILGMFNPATIGFGTFGLGVTAQ